MIYTRLSQVRYNIAIKIVINVISCDLMILSRLVYHYINLKKLKFIVDFILNYGISKTILRRLILLVYFHKPVCFFLCILLSSQFFMIFIFKLVCIFRVKYNFQVITCYLLSPQNYTNLSLS